MRSIWPNTKFEIRIFNWIWGIQRKYFLTLTATVFIGTIIAIGFTVTEKTALLTITTTACQLTLITERCFGVQFWLDFTLFALELAIFHRIFPITCLLLNIEEKTSRATNCLKTLVFFFKFVCNLKKVKQTIAIRFNAEQGSPRNHFVCDAIF